MDDLIDVKLRKFESRVVAICDERIRLFADDLYQSMRRGNTELARKLDMLRAGMTGKCDFEMKDDIPAELADMLDVCRTQHPDTYAVMLKHAELFAAAEPTDRNDVADRANKEIHALLGGTN